MSLQLATSQPRTFTLVDDNTAMDARADARIAALTPDIADARIIAKGAPIPAIGQMFQPYGEGNNASVAATLNLALAGVFIPRKAMTVDQVQLEVTAAGAAGAVVRIGLYADNGGAKPGARIVDNGTVITTGIGVQTLAVNWVLAALDPVWIVCVSQVAVCSLRVCPLTMTPELHMGRTAGVPGDDFIGLTMAAVAGALPTPFVEDNSARPVKLLLRRSA